MSGREWQEETRERFEGGRRRDLGWKKDKKRETHKEEVRRVDTQNKRRKIDNGNIWSGKNERKIEEVDVNCTETSEEERRKEEKDR